jgi:hypothetical protein
MNIGLRCCGLARSQDGEPVFISISPTTGRAYSIYKSADSGSILVAINTALS